MKLVSADDVRLRSSGIPEEHLIDLVTGWAQVFRDGWRALSCGNPTDTQKSKADLRSCLACAKTEVPGIRIVDGDAWAKHIGPNRPDNSSDWLVAAEQDGEVRLYCVDGKLGEIFDYPGDKGGVSLTLRSLLDKYKGMSALVSQGKGLSRKFLIIVPNCGRESTWHQIRSWALQLPSDSVQFYSCCVLEWLRLFAGSAKQPCQDKDKKARVRWKLIEREFAVPEKLPKVLLPVGVGCTGCGRCEERCGKHAIKMVNSTEGVKIPSIDTALCTACRYCETVCPVLRASE